MGSSRLSHKTGHQSAAGPVHAGAGMAVAVAVLVAGCVGVAVAVVNRWAPSADEDRNLESAAHQLVLVDPRLLGAARVVTTAGSPEAMDVLAVLLVIGLLARRRVRAAGYVAAVRLIELAVETTIKDLVARPRPQWSDPVATATGYSFPSGHAAGSAAMLTTIVVLVARAGTADVLARRVVALTVGLAALFVAAVVVSRVLLGVHYPSDVLAGALLGTAVALALTPILPAPHHRAAVSMTTHP